MTRKNKTINGCHVSPAKQALLTLLGEPWTMQQIDFEPCVYRDLGSFDIEISGGRTRKAEIFIYVVRSALFSVWSNSTRAFITTWMISRRSVMTLSNDTEVQLHEQHKSEICRFIRK